MRFTQNAYCLFTVGVGIGLLLFVIAACSTIALVTHDDPLPQLLEVIEMPQEKSTRDIAVTQGGYAYVLNETSDSIAVLDGPKLITLMRIEAEGTVLMRDIVAHPVTGLVYVADVHQGVHVISGTKIITTITDLSVDRGFDILTVHPNTGYVYAGGVMRDQDTKKTFANIRIISGTQVLTDIVNGKSFVNSLTPDPRDNHLYVGHTFKYEHPGTPLVSVIDGTNLIMTTTLDYDPTTMRKDVTLRDIIVNPVSDELYLQESIASIVFWGKNDLERTNLRMEYGPISGMGFDPIREILYFGIQSSPYAIAIKKNRSLHELRIVAGSKAIVYDKTRDYMYTADYNGPSMSVIRGTRVLATLSTGGRGPRDVGVDEERGYIYVSNADSSSIAVFGFEDEVSDTTLQWQDFVPLVIEEE